MAGVRCPQCDVPMREVPRRGVVIDVCPECRGVWLDRGELDKLLAGTEGWDDDPPADRRHQQPPQPGHPKRKSIWRELFDFD